MTEESRRIQQAERARVEADARHHQQIADDRRRAQEALQRRIEAQARERAQVVARKIEQDRESRRRENQPAKAADTRKMIRESRDRKQLSSRNSESKSPEPHAERLLPGDAIVDEFARQVTAREQAEGPRLELTAEFAKPDYIREAQTRTSAADRLAAAERVRRGDRADSLGERAPTERLEAAQRVRSEPPPRGNQEYHERDR